MRKLQSQGVHHITIVGADRQTSIDFWEGVLGMPFVFEQPNLDNAVREPPVLRSGRRAADHGLHQRGARARPGAHADRPRLRAPPRVRGLAGDVRPGRRAPRRARDPPQRRQGPRLHGLDLLRGPARAADRARVLPLRAARAASRTPTCCSRPTSCASSAATTTSTAIHLADAIEDARPRARGSRSPTTASPADPYHKQTAVTRRGDTHGRLHAQHPQAEREQPDRADLRARRGPGLRGGRRLGQDDRAGVPRQVPGAPDADARGRPACRAARSGRAARSWPTCATSTGSTASTRPIRAERAMVDNAMFYLIGHVLSAPGAGDLPDARLPAVRGRGRDLAGGRRRAQGAGRRRTRPTALAEPLDAYRAFFLDGKQFIGGDHPSIADIRLAATLEFLRSIDYEFPAWTEEYMSGDGGDARRRVLRAGRRRARLRRVGEGARRSGALALTRRSTTGSSAARTAAPARRGRGRARARAARPRRCRRATGP